MATWGVRYFHSELPPRDQWEADLSLIAASGLKCVAVPVRWADAQPAEDAFALDHLAEFAAIANDNGLGLIGAVDLTCVPLWLSAAHSEALFQDAAGRKLRPGLTPAAPGWPGLCLDNGAVRASAGRFLRAVGSTVGAAVGAAVGAEARLLAYDLSGFSALGKLLATEPRRLFCQCPGSRGRFVSWLRRMFADDLDALCSACGLTFRQWGEVAPPREPGRFPLGMLWERFRRENARAQLRWCVEALREADPAAHILAASQTGSPCTVPDLASVAQEASEAGCLVGSESLLLASDWCRRQARGKRPWLLEVPATRERSVRRSGWAALATNAPNLVFSSWRPDRWAESERPSLVGHDGEPTRRLPHLMWFLELMKAHGELAEATPSEVEAGVLVVPESSWFWSAAGKAELYGRALRGAHRALASRGAQVAFAWPDDLDGLPLVYAPLAPAMGHETAEALRRYVEAGGRLVAEMPFARFDPLARALDDCPGWGLTDLFGATAPDPPQPVGEPPPAFTGRRGSFVASHLYQPLLAAGGSAKARFPNGMAAIVDNSLGRGAARLLATNPSLGLGTEHWRGHRRVILDSLAFARIRLRVRVSSPGILVRLLTGRDGQPLLCGFNPEEAVQEATVRVSRSLGHFRRAYDLASGKWRRLRDNARRFKLAPSEGFILRLEGGAPSRRWRRRSARARR